MVQRSFLPLPVDLESPQRVGYRLLLASVVFGQSSLGCRGNGICRVDMVTSSWQNTTIDQLNNLEGVCIWNPVEISRNLTETMRFTIYKDWLHPITKAKFFSKDYFEVEELFKIPDYLIEALDLRKNWVSIGVYDIKKLQNALIIDF